MKQTIVPTLADRYRNFVLTGESGAGKTEAALNLGLALRAGTRRPVHIFDMDQTKPLFRARDLEPELAAAGIAMHAAPQKLDEPTLPPGVIESLQNADIYTILDVGGGGIGARMIGQLSNVLHDGGCRVFFVVNPYRPWSQSAAALRRTFDEIARAGRFQQVRLISNPNLGPSTTAEEVVEGHSRLLSLISEDWPVDFLTVRRPLYEEVRRAVALPVLPLDRRIAYPGSE